MSVSTGLRPDDTLIAELIAEVVQDVSLRRPAQDAVHFLQHGTGLSIVERGGPSAREPHAARAASRAIHSSGGCP